MSVIIKGKNPRKPHTVRYWDGGRQRERSFATLGEAKGFRTDADHATRYANPVDSAAGRMPFGDACQTWVGRHPGAPRTRELYAGIVSKWIRPALGTRTLASVAADRDAVAELLGQTMGHLSLSRREAAHAVILGTLDEAVTAGKLPRHRAAGIGLADNKPRNGHTGFVFPSHRQVEQVAASVGIAVWLMRGCGLRIEEALGVERADFREHGATLRVCGQASQDGQNKVPLKHRRPGEYRDVPVPSWLWAIVEGLPGGPLCPGRNGARYATYSLVGARFRAARIAAGIEDGFTAHSLRHLFASALLAAGVPITDVAHFLGHRTIDQTFAVYSHLIPSAAGRAVAALDAEYASWQAETS